jgi:signal transduction histidine kinase
MHLADTKRERLGLVGMGERAHMLGGSMNIESTPGHGTRISARLPLISDKSAKAAAR